LKTERYLFDTHALIFWSSKEFVSKAFTDFFDEQVRLGYVFVSSIFFWEAAFLSKKGKIELRNIHEWKAGLLENTNIRIIDPSASEMIDSTLLPNYHKDPFDRLLIVQANCNDATLVTKDEKIKTYSVRTLWI